MSELLIYQFKAAMVMVVFYLSYRIIASKENYHRLNRIMLIITPLLSFILPLCVITTTQIVTIKQSIIDPTIISDQLQTTLQEYKSDNHVINWISILTSIYYTGSILLSAYIITIYVKLGTLIKRSKTIEHHIATIYTTTKNIIPCSWFSNIIIPKSELNHDAEMIIAHENAHSMLKHSYDIVIIDLCCVVQWFNPAIWFIRRDLKELHEYEADNYVITQGYSLKQYQLLLIKKAAGHESYSIANNLNHSSLKNRITMMLSKKSSVMSRLKLLYVVPLIGISLTAFAQTNTVTVVDSNSKDSKNYSVNKTLILHFPIKSTSPAEITSKYGERTNKTSGNSSFHTGIDIKVKEGTPVLASLGGVVKEVGDNPQTKGRYVIISHENNYQTEYTHLFSYCVSKDQKVDQGGTIGRVGSSGKSTGSHLHMELRKDGKPIDPTPLFSTTQISKQDSSEYKAALYITSNNNIDKLCATLKDFVSRYGNKTTLEITTTKETDLTKIKKAIRDLGITKVTYNYNETESRANDVAIEISYKDTL